MTSAELADHRRNITGFPASQWRMAPARRPSTIIALATAALLGVAGCGGPNNTPTPPPVAQSPATGSSTTAQAIDCGPLRSNLLECVEVVAIAANGLSSDHPRDQVKTVQVLPGSSYTWCLPEGCVDPPAQSAWVQFNWSVSSWERMPLYVDPLDPDIGWQAGFPLDLLPSPSPSLAPS